MTYTGEVTLALSEYIGLALLPELARKLQVQAPRLNIRVITRVQNELEQLAQGQLDFVIQVEHAHYGNEFKVARLGPSATILLAREHHPIATGEVSWERLADFPLIRLYVSDADQVEIQRSVALYAQLLESRRGFLEISHLLTALEVLRTTDYLMPSPSYILQNEAATRGIRALPMPDNSSASIDYALVSHQRTSNSGLHNWLWEEIRCTIRELRNPLPNKPRQRVKAGSTDPLP
jgi:DNA-binding transcriptional LysR family regulator